MQLPERQRLACQRKAFVFGFASLAGSLGFWTERFRERNVVFEPAQRRFGEEALAFQDPDGLQLNLVEVGGLPGRSPCTRGGVSDAAALR